MVLVGPVGRPLSEPLECHDLAFPSSWSLNLLHQGISGGPLQPDPGASGWTLGEAGLE